MYCEQVCIAQLGEREQRGFQPNEVVRAIRKDYHNKWFVDNLPSASIVEDETTITTKWFQGFPIGYVSFDDNKAYIYNHVNIEIMYHPVETETDESEDFEEDIFRYLVKHESDKDLDIMNHPAETNKYRVVRFFVRPFSIKHDFETSKKDAAVGKFRVANVYNPIPSCSGGDVHTDYNMITAPRREPQLASGKVLFTYDVIWRKNRDLKWANRWDIYLTMHNAIPAKVHLLSIATSLVFILVLSYAIATKLIKDFARYKRLVLDEEKAEDCKEEGYKLVATDEVKAEDSEKRELKSVHADVFRPPSFSPLLFSCACGTGAQMSALSFFLIVLSAMGLLSPANRGSLLMGGVILYVAMGSVAGYVTARFYKTFKGESWQFAAACTALGFPGISFIALCVKQSLTIFQGFTYSVPFITMIQLFVLWLGVSAPLVFLGAYFGYKQDAIEIPIMTAAKARQIPDQPWYTTIWRIFFTLASGGLPFGACFVELYFILASMWTGQYYSTFCFLLLVYFILIVTCAEIAIMLCYFQLCREKRHCWWRSFCTAGIPALYVFLYSIVHFRQWRADSFSTYVLYFGYMGWVSLGLFMMTGFIGVVSSLYFNKAIFSYINIDK